MGAASPNPAWVPPQPGRATPTTAPDNRQDVALALRLLDQAARAWTHNPDLTHRLTGEAVGLIGPDAVLTILGLQAAGRLPEAGTPQWGRLLDLADAGDVQIATVILIRDRDYICDDQVAERVRHAPPPPSGPPVSLAAEFRQMGMLD